MEQTFAGKVVLVTGANSGIGEASALAFAAAGASVYAVARRADALSEARARHSHIHWLLGDVSNGPEIRGVVERVVTEARRLDVVVNSQQEVVEGREVAAMNLALAMLPDEQRRVLELKYFSGLSARRSLNRPAQRSEPSRHGRAWVSQS